MPPISKKAPKLEPKQKRQNESQVLCFEAWQMALGSLMIVPRSRAGKPQLAEVVTIVQRSRGSCDVHVKESEWSSEYFKLDKGEQVKLADMAITMALARFESRMMDEVWKSCEICARSGIPAIIAGKTCCIRCYTTDMIPGGSTDVERDMTLDHYAPEQVPRTGDTYAKGVHDDLGETRL